MARIQNLSTSDVSRREFARRSLALGGLVSVGGGGLLAACADDAGDQNGSSSDQAADDETGSSPDQTTIDLAVSHWPTQFRNLPWAIAVERGLFEDRGISIAEFLTSVGGGQTLRNMSLGDLPFADGSAPAAIAAWEAGVPLQIVGTMARLRQRLMALPETEVSGLDDLAGKRLAFTSPGSVSELVLYGLLGEAGAVDSAELVSVGGVDQMLPALQRDLVDVAIGPLELDQLVAAGEVKEVINLGEALPAYVDTSLIASQQAIRENPDLIQSIVEVKIEATEWLLDNQDQSVQIFAEVANVDLDAAESQLELNQPLDSFLDSTVPVEWLEQLQAGLFFADRLPTDEDGAPRQIDFGSIINQDFLPSDMRTDIPDSIPLPS